MVSAFDVQLPFFVRDKRRHRLSVAELNAYRDIALTDGHTGKALRGVKDAFRASQADAASVANLMRQVDINAVGFLAHGDFSVALSRSGVSLSADQTNRLFDALKGAGTGRGCDIEMFAYLVDFWCRGGQEAGAFAGNLTSHVSTRKSLPCILNDVNSSSRERDCQNESVVPLSSRDRLAVVVQDANTGDRFRVGGRAASDGLASEAEDRVREGAVLPGHHGEDHSMTRAMQNLAAAGKRNSYAENMANVFCHATPTKENSSQHDMAQAINCADASPQGRPCERATREEHQESRGGRESPSGARSECSLDMMRPPLEASQAPDEAYLHSLGYGTLSTILPILLDRMASLEAYVERLDQVGAGRVRSTEFMAAVRQVGVALSTVQEANFMDLLRRMGAIRSHESTLSWIDIKAGLTAVAIAAEKVEPRAHMRQARLSLFEEGTRMLEVLSRHYADVHVALLPSPLLLGPNAARQRRDAPDDGGRDVLVTTGTFREALRTSGLLLGETDERVLWRLLQRRARELTERCNWEGLNEARERGTIRLLGSGIIPLPLLDAVMDFDEESALRAWRGLQRLAQRPSSALPGSHPEHVGLLGDHPAANRDSTTGAMRCGAPLLLQKARARVKDLGTSLLERTKVLLRYLPKLGPSGERRYLPRDELTRVLQQLRVGVRSGELQNLWYHMDRKKITRESFRSLLLDSAEKLLVTFPASPCPYPAGPPAPVSEISSGDGTPLGGVSISGAKLQHRLNRAAYEENVRRAAGSALPVSSGAREDEGMQEAHSDVSSGEGAGSFYGSSPPSPGQNPQEVASRNELPLPLQKAVDKVGELGNADEVIRALVPDTGHRGGDTPITRGGIQRALHGLGVIPRSGELQHLWWFLERGAVGDPRVSVSQFRALLRGHQSKIELLPVWRASDAPATKVAADGREDDGSIPRASVLRAMRTALGLVRRRVAGIIRGCEDRDLSADGWLTEEAFLAVLKEQGILQQLGEFGLSILRQAVAADEGQAEREETRAKVRYTALVGAIDQYLDEAASWGGSHLATRLGLDVASDKDDGGASSVESDLGVTRPGRDLAPMDSCHEDEIGLENVGGARPTARPCTAPPAPSARAKRIFAPQHPPNSVARATRGWENDAPEVPLGMRHYPRRTCRMAALLGSAPTVHANGSTDKAGTEFLSDNWGKGKSRFQKRSCPASEAADCERRSLDSVRIPSSQTRELRGEADRAEVKKRTTRSIHQTSTDVHRSRRGKMLYSRATFHSTTRNAVVCGSIALCQAREDAYPDEGGVRTHSQTVRYSDDVPLLPPAAADTNYQQHATPVSAACMRDALRWGNDNHADDAVRSESRGLEADRDDGSSECFDFVPAGGASSVARPAWCGGRRGSVNKVANLAGGGVSRAICWTDEFGADMNGPRREEAGEGGTRKHGHANENVRVYPASAREAHEADFSSSSSCSREDAAPTVLDIAEARADSSAGGNDPDLEDATRGAPRSPLQPRHYDEAKGRSVHVRHIAKALLSDGALLAGVFNQLAGMGDIQGRKGLDRARLVKLFVYPRLPPKLSLEEAEVLADGVLSHCGTESASYTALTAFLTAAADPWRTCAWTSRHALHDDSASSRAALARRLLDDPIAQSIKRDIMQGRSKLRLAGDDAEGRLACSVQLRRAFRRRQKSLGGDPGSEGDCSVGASDLTGVLQDLGVSLNPTQSSYVISRCGRHRIPGSRSHAGGRDEAPIRAGAVLDFFGDLLVATPDP